VGKEAFQDHFIPRYNPWEQRIAVAIGLKDKVRTGAIGIRTAAIERFTESALVLKGGERLECDVCILATGLNLRFFSFDIHVGDREIDLERINFHKGLLVGGIPNYFHPMGSWHSAWTQRCEPLTRAAIRIMRHMKAQGLGTVSVPRREVPCRPGITPNYVKRALATMPRLEGTTDLPTLDNMDANRFDATRLHFA
jgi:monooxygenase